MTARPPVLQLTWAGFEAAVDVIAAQCWRRDRSGVHAATPDARILAMAMCERLSLHLLPLPTDGMLLVDLADSAAMLNKAIEHTDVEPWVWVDNSPDHRWNSAMKVQGGALLSFPWQQLQAARNCRRPFVPGFDD